MWSNDGRAGVCCYDGTKNVGGRSLEAIRPTPAEPTRKACQDETNDDDDAADDGDDDEAS